MSPTKQKMHLIHLENLTLVSPPAFPLVPYLIAVTLHYDGDDYHSDELYLREHHRTAIAEA